MVEASPISRTKLLEQPVTYSGDGISVRMLEEAIRGERVRQNHHVADLGALRTRTSELQGALGEEMDKLRTMGEQLEKRRDLKRSFWDEFREILARLPGFKGVAVTRRSVEELLRAQYELSARRVKEAAEFADRLKASQAELFDEVERLNQRIIDSAKNEERAAEYILEVQKLKIDVEAKKAVAEAGSVEARELQATIDQARRRLVEHSAMLKLYSTAEERLDRLKQRTRQLADTIGHLQSDINIYVAAAGEKLDLIAGQIQAVGAAADASVVMLELRESLSAMTESMNLATRFVSETQAYFRQNVDQMIEDLEVYDDETRQILDANLGVTDAFDDMMIAEAVSEAMARKADVVDPLAAEIEQAVLESSSS